jgi:hypothetical protein
LVPEIDVDIAVLQILGELKLQAYQEKSQNYNTLIKILDETLKMRSLPGRPKLVTKLHKAALILMSSRL